MRKTAPIEINPSLLGFGPGYADEAWEQLLTDEAVEATDDMLRGQRLEAVAAELLAQKTGLQLTETGLWKASLEGIPIAASPDRLTSNGKLVEIKAPRAFSSTPRESTVLQAQLQLPHSEVWVGRRRALGGREQRCCPLRVASGRELG